MKNKPRISARPPVAPHSGLEDFIARAEEPPRSETKKEAKSLFPWEQPNVRPDVKKAFILRLPEPLMLKLQFIHEKTEKSMHKFCMEILEPAIEKEVERLKRKI